MPPTKVIIVGCGIAGPILAIFLKLKGYEPVIYERVQRNSDVGLSLMLQVNGLRLLSLIPGLVDRIPGMAIEKFEFSSSVPGDVGILVQSDLPKTYFQETYGLGLMGVQRTKFLQLITGVAEEHGIEIRWDYNVVDLEQGDDYVRVKFEDGTTDTASFVVGCDGLHSRTRIALFGTEKADFTGLTQTGGLSPTPEHLSKTPTMINVFGEDSHMVAYSVSPTHYSWAISQREDESKETWRQMDDDAQDRVRAGQFSEWPFGAGDLVKTAERIVKYGLYDRPELASWHKGRVVLLGDAAHPTSPHLGQGANQAFEDIYHLVRLLVKYNPEAAAPPTEVLSKVFTEYEELRITRTSGLVRGARKMGETRVVQGRETCLARNEDIRKTWSSRDGVIQSYESMLKGPFVGLSEI